MYNRAVVQSQSIHKVLFYGHAECPGGTHSVKERTGACVRQNKGYSVVTLLL